MSFFNIYIFKTDMASSLRYMLFGARAWCEKKTVL